MNERLPYEHSLKEKLQEISLPEMEPSWQKMKKLLKEEDDDKLLPPYLMGCAGLGILLLALIAGFWFYNNQKEKTKDSSLKTQIKKTDSILITGNKQQQISDTVAMNSGSVIHDKKSENKKAEPITSAQTNDTFNSNLNVSSTTHKNYKDPSKINSGSVKNKKAIIISDNIYVENNSPRKKKRKIQSSSKTAMSISAALPATDKNHAVENNFNKKKSSKRKTVPAKTKMNITLDSSNLSAQDVVEKNIDTTIVIKIDSSTNPIDSTVVMIDSLPNNDTSKVAAEKKQKEKKKNEYYFAAGLSLQYQFPINGQQSNNYDAFGRKNSLKDYVPAAYIRFYKKNTWFFHTGFRYGAPQSVKEVPYNSTSSLDSNSGQIVTNRSSFTVRKTFYHQVPFSFNYFITPKLSIGTGIMYSLFNGALTEKENTITVTRQGIDSVISSNKEFIKVPASGDSFFSRTQFNFTVQAEFHWKRFGIGAQYTKGLQPYLKFKEAGVLKQLKNESLQIFIRYELWRQKKR